MPGSTDEGSGRSASAVLEPERGPRQGDPAALCGRRASLAQSGADRAAYATSADVRLAKAQPLTGTDATRALAALAALPGVMGITPVFRGLALGSSDVNAPPATLLPVAGVVSWRADYAAASPGALMVQLQAHQWSTAAAGSALVALGAADHPL